MNCVLLEIGCGDCPSSAREIKAKSLSAAVYSSWCHNLYCQDCCHNGNISNYSLQSIRRNAFLILCLLESGDCCDEVASHLAGQPGCSHQRQWCFHPAAGSGAV